MIHLKHFFSILRTSVQTCKEDDPPGGIEEDHAKGHDGADNEEVVRLPVHAQGARPEAGREDVDQGEGPGHEAKPEANHVGEDVFVGKYLSLLILCQFLQVGVCFVEQEIDEKSECFLKHHRKH